MDVPQGFVDSVTHYNPLAYGPRSIRFKAGDGYFRDATVARRWHFLGSISVNTAVSRVHGFTDRDAHEGCRDLLSQMYSPPTDRMLIAVYEKLAYLERPPRKDDVGEITPQYLWVATCPYCGDILWKQDVPERNTDHPNPDGDRK